MDDLARTADVRRAAPAPARAARRPDPLATTIAPLCVAVVVVLGVGLARVDHATTAGAADIEFDGGAGSFVYVDDLAAARDAVAPATGRGASRAGARRPARPTSGPAAPTPSPPADRGAGPAGGGTGAGTGGGETAPATSTPTVSVTPPSTITDAVVDVPGTVESLGAIGAIDVDAGVAVGPVAVDADIHLPVLIPAGS